jgi:hypothetical protein
MPLGLRGGLAAGTLEEKVFQRQLSKEGLSNVVNQSGKSAASLMSAEDLADLFTPDFGSLSSTYDSMLSADERTTTATSKDSPNESTQPIPSDDTPVQRPQARCHISCTAIACLQAILCSSGQDVSWWDPHLLCLYLQT